MRPRVNHLRENHSHRWQMTRTVTPTTDPAALRVKVLSMFHHTMNPTEKDVARLPGKWAFGLTSNRSDLPFHSDGELC
eukprot:1909597-Amphidinium_carterae.1